MEFPSAVETLEILAPFRQDLASFLDICKGKDVSSRLQLVERQLFRALPLSSIRSRNLLIEKAFKVVFGTYAKYQSREDEGCQDVFHSV